VRIIICDSIGIIVKWGNISVDWGSWGCIGWGMVGKGDTSDKGKDSKLEFRVKVTDVKNKGLL
jgi:hypothetical protein